MSQKIAIAWMLAALAMMLASCGDETFYNHQAAPPKQETLELVDLKQGQHVDGVVTIKLSPGDSTTKVVTLVDSVVVSELYNNNVTTTYVIEIDTRQWPEGNHKISIGVSKLQAPEIGLLSLIEFPYLIYSIDVVFDRTPATPVTLVSVEWDVNSSSPLLTWTKNADPNFYAYIIYRKWQSSIEEVGRVYDQNQLSANDSLDLGTIGFTYTYYVEASNRYQSPPSNEITFSYPPVVDATPGSTISQFIHPIVANTRSVLYVLEENSIKMISTVTHEVVGVFSTTNYPINFALSSDESTLFVVSTYEPKFRKLDAVTLSQTFSTTLAFNASAVICGRADRLYVTTSHPFPGPVMILDAANGSVIGQVGVNALNGQLAISPDHNTLYIAAPSPTSYEVATVYKTNITTDTPNTLLQKVASDWIRWMQLSSDGQHLFLLHDFDYPAALNNFVDYWDVNSFNSVKKFMVPKQAFDFSANGSSVFIISGERTLQYFSPGQVIQYSIQTNQVTNSWDFRNAPRLVQATPGNDLLYVYGDSFWALDF